MAIENFNWEAEKRRVTWTSGGVPVKANISNMYFASVNLDDKYVYIEAGVNYTQDTVYYLSENGQIIFSFSKPEDKIVWFYKGEYLNYTCKGIITAQLFLQHNIILAITSKNQLNNRLLGINLDGTLVFDTSPPSGFNFLYLSSVNSFPTVICDGGDNNIDDYGRNRWHFIIDTKTGNLSKANLAY